MEAIKPNPPKSQFYGSIDKQNINSDQQATPQAANLSKCEVLPSCLFDPKPITRRICKNLAVLSVAMLLVFTAQYCITNLQSIIHPENGTRSLALMFVGKTISSFILSSWLVRKITAKWTIVLGVLGFACFAAVHFYPRTYTLLPTAFLMGLTAAPLWAAIGSYVNKLGYNYAHLMCKDIEVVQSQMFGVFFAFNQLSFVAESIINAAFLGGHAALNETASSDVPLKICGIFYCPQMEPSGNQSIFFSTTIPAATEQIGVICCVVLSLHAIGAAAVILFLDHIDSFECLAQVEECSSYISSREATCSFPRLLALTPDLVLLAPLPVWAGFLQGFILSDFSRAYIDCGLGVHMLGFVMMVFGGFATLGALVLGPMVQQVGQTPVIAAGGASCAGLIVLMFVWTTHSDLSPLLFVGAGLGGWADAVGQSQVRVLFGSTFPLQPIKSSSTLVFLESIGFFLNYILQPVVCNLTKTAVLITLLTLAMLGVGLQLLRKRRCSSTFLLTSLTSQHTQKVPE